MADQSLYPAEAADPHCLGEQEAARLLAGHPWRRFAVVGDSIAEGLGDPSPGYRNEPWCDRIAAALRRQRPGLSYLNLGRSMATAAEVRSAQLDQALAFSPDLALASCGGADLLRFSYDPDAVEAELRAIVSAFTRAGSDVVTVGLFDGSYAPGIPAGLRARQRERLHDLAGRTRSVADEFGCMHVGLTWHPASRDADMYSADPRHGSMRGHAIAAAECIRVLGAQLAAAGPQTASPAARPG